jgi:isopentenyl-diphosphate Delta-isomerase
MQENTVLLPDNDPTASERKKDHIELALKSQIQHIDTRFYYEPLLTAHPDATDWGAFSFLGKNLKNPMWVSSMTGGTAMARIINHNLARACGDFGMGMGLGSCRSLLYSDEMLPDFDVRHLIGDAQPLYANLGIGQLEELIIQDKTHLINDLIEKLKADGLIIHVNPMQEWLQPEGDRFKYTPLQTIETIIEKIEHKIIVKEVGQGFGYESLKTLFQLPIAALDFAAAGGTNFAKLELLRSDTAKQEVYNAFAHIGHSADDMVTMSNEILAVLGNKVRCKEVIISGGIKNFLDGYYLIEKLNTNAIYGQASAFLNHARGNYDDLATYIEAQVQGLILAKAMLKVK